MMKVLLCTPPFTQLNTPYPATAYLHGFLKSQGVASAQVDLSISLFNRVFSSDFIKKVFSLVDPDMAQEVPLVWRNRQDYIDKVDTVIRYLQQQEVTTAYQLLKPGYLPKGHRFELLDEDLNWAFGNLGILDKAKHFATLFVEELGDFIRITTDEFFAFTKYAEQIATAASSFDELYDLLHYEPTIIEEELTALLKEEIQKHQPNLIGFTIPFPGNLFSALRCSQWIKRFHPNIKVVFGGGYCNTELLSLRDPRIFEFIDFITYEKGEAPLLNLTKLIKGEVEVDELERTRLLEGGEVVYKNRLPNTGFHHKDMATPSYEGLNRSKYLSFLDVMNPMHRLWSDGNWNKLTVSHGCYWKQCSFCDVSLDYIGNYQNTTASDLVNKIEAMIDETGINGFHFVDEAAPPKMLKALAEELLRRKVNIVWWTNIRFEKTFDVELCSLLSQSGCIAVTGGLEVASDRLLEKMKKGVDIAQVAAVTKAFAQNDIMVHAYLMYGFPTETAQETIDSLEIVRQLFLAGCIHSAFWHKFTCTAHSPVGKNPDLFGIKVTGPEFKGFALNDLFHEDPTGADHNQFTEGLNEALNAYMNGVGLQEDIQVWFDFEVQPSSHSKDLIATCLR